MTDNQHRENYRGIVKGTAIFGGVQVFQILINIVRGKFVAMFLGPEGMGIMSLFTSTTNTINQFTGFGLSLSAVKDISQANEQGDFSRLSRVAAVFRRLTTATGLLAAVIVIIGAPWLSEFTFGSRDYTWGFMALAIMLFFLAKSSAQTSILQGTRQLKSLARSTIIGAAAGLVIGVPLYIFFGTDGIVPSMIVAALTTYLTGWYFTSKLKLEKAALSTAEVAREGRSMLTLGTVMMISTLLGTVVVYLINVFVRWYGDAADVGLYQGASSITNQYVGMVFAAMAVDYFPRLAAINEDNDKVSQMVSRQIEIVMLVVAPLVVAILVSAPLVVKILLTSDFLPIITLMSWLALGLVIKAFAYPIGYIAFAKGDKRTFFWLEGVASNVVTLLSSIAGYAMLGINGLGIAYLVSIAIYLVVILVVARVKYDFRPSASIVGLVLPMIGLTAVTFLFFITMGYTWWSYCIGVALIGASVAYSYYHLNRLVDIKEFIKDKFSKKHQKSE